MFRKLTIFTFMMFFASGCVIAADDKKAADEEDFDAYEMLNLFGEIMERTKTSYVEEVTDSKLIAFFA